jgi:hypothetical protein
VHNATYRELLHGSLTNNTALERHNAQPNSIADDFERFGLDIWAAVDRERSGKAERRRKLSALITWRNAIAHDDIDSMLSKGALQPVTISSARAVAGVARSTSWPHRWIKAQLTRTCAPKTLSA